MNKVKESSNYISIIGTGYLEHRKKKIPTQVATYVETQNTG